MPIKTTKEMSGRYISLSSERTMICDLIHFGKQVPSVPVQRTMRLGNLVEARRQATFRPSWCALFVRAFAKVAQDMPELRRSYLTFPTARFYEHSVSIASIAVERQKNGNPVIGFAKVINPMRREWRAIDRYLDHFSRSSVKNMTAAKIALRISRLWRPLRLMIWWMILNVSGYWRTRSLGTFSVSVYSSLGADSLHPITPVPFCLNYGPIDENGVCNVRIIYDHRILDGATVARALVALEIELTGPTVAELQSLSASTPALTEALGVESETG